MIFGGQKKQSLIQDEIDRVVTLMSAEKPDSDEYAKMNKQLGKLHEQRMAEKPKPLDAATLVTISANLAGILLIVGHERAHVVTSKAMSLLRPVR